MTLAMTFLAVLAFVCFAVGATRPILSGWVPAITMLASMLAAVVYEVDPTEGTVPLLWAAPLLLVTGVAAARGGDRLMGVHRGLSAIAMAVLALVIVADLPAEGFSGAAHDEHGSAWSAMLIVFALIASACGVAATMAWRDWCNLSRARVATAPGSVVSGRVSAPVQVTMGWRSLSHFEAPFMTAALALMAIHS